MSSVIYIVKNYNSQLIPPHDEYHELVGEKICELMQQRAILYLVCHCTKSEFTQYKFKLSFLYRTPS